MKKRFYDQDPAISRAVEVLMLLPEEMQSIIADGMSLIAEEEFKANELLNDFRSIGTDKVLAIYKSKQKKRKYDKNPSTHRAMNYMMVLSPENRLLISKKIVELMGYVQDYLKACQANHVDADNLVVGNLTDVYVKFGSDETRQFLRAVQQEFKRKLESEPVVPPKPKDDDKQSNGFVKQVNLQEAIRDEGLGMRIKGDLK